MLPLSASYYRRKPTTGRISVFARLPQRSLRFGSQTLCGVHVGSDTFWQKALETFLTDQLVEAPTA